MYWTMSRMLFIWSYMHDQNIVTQFMCPCFETFLKFNLIVKSILTGIVK